MKTSRILMIIGAASLSLLFILPLWSITLGAPQYPEPLGMDIWINKIVGSHQNDIQNINLMNHYVGMNKIPDYMLEFDIFPIVISSMSIIGIILGFFGKPWMFLSWFCVMTILGIAGMYDFYLWEYEYGHSLDPKAAIKFMDDNGEIMAYQPPLFGTKLILNFTATSLPLSGAYFMFFGMLLTFTSFFVGKKALAKNNKQDKNDDENENHQQKETITKQKAVLASFIMLIALSSCSVEPSPINYGMDACHFCKMGIVDKQHGSEIVTKKGKTYKYDAVECMLNDLKERNEKDIALLLVNTFDNPIELEKVESVTFLVSEKLPSPMGAFLTAFSNEEVAQKKLNEIGGKLYTWEELIPEF